MRKQGRPFQCGRAGGVCLHQLSLALTDPSQLFLLHAALSLSTTSLYIPLQSMSSPFPFLVRVM